MADNKGGEGTATQRPHTKPLEMMGRTDWSAVPPRWTTPLQLPVSKIFLMATSRPPCFGQSHCISEMQRLQNYQMLHKTIPDIRYNFVISPRGTVFEGRGWLNSPSLPTTYAKIENQSLFIGFSGDFRDRKTVVPPEMLDAMELLFKLGVDYKYITPDFDTFDLC